MKILVLNCGSSSIKYQLIDMDNNATLLAKGLLERIGLEMGEFTHKPVGKDKYYVQQPIPDHKAGIKMVLEALVDEKIGVIASLTEINACGHRVAHGGEIFKQSVLVGEKEKEQIRALFALAPLHNPANLQGIEAMQAILPNVPQVAVFDTSFHQSMPAEAYLYAIPYEYYQTDKVRRYGFHGTSHRFVAPKAAKMAGLDINNSKIISCHLGSGASICAVKDGKSVDTSMGFTPLAGIAMGTRSGDLDPSIVTDIMEKENITAKEMNSILNKKSGLYGITGLNPDFREIENASKEPDKPKAKIAIKLFTRTIAQFIAKYAVSMEGIDLVVFTGGIGENQIDIRKAICKNIGCY